MNQALGSIFIIPTPAARTAPWVAQRNGVAVSGLGNAELVQGPLTAFFASRQCPGSAIRAATAWALHQPRTNGAVISGFHSPLEQSVLRLLVEAGSPVVLVLARPVAGALLRKPWRQALDAGRLAIVSHSVHLQRLTQQAADARNELAARLAQRITIAHASPGGRLSQQCVRWLADGLDIGWFEANSAPN